MSHQAVHHSVVAEHSSLREIEQPLLTLLGNNLDDMLPDLLKNLCDIGNVVLNKLAVWQRTLSLLERLCRRLHIRSGFELQHRSPALMQRSDSQHG